MAQKSSWWNFVTLELPPPRPLELVQLNRKWPHTYRICVITTSSRPFSRAGTARSKRKQNKMGGGEEKVRKFHKFLFNCSRPTPGPFLTHQTLGHSGHQALANFIAKDTFFLQLVNFSFQGFYCRLGAPIIAQWCGHFCDTLLFTDWLFLYPCDVVFVVDVRVFRGPVRIAATVIPRAECECGVPVISTCFFMTRVDSCLQFTTTTIAIFLFESFQQQPIRRLSWFLKFGKNIRVSKHIHCRRQSHLFSHRKLMVRYREQNWNCIWKVLQQFPFAYFPRMFMKNHTFHCHFTKSWKKWMSQCKTTDLQGVNQVWPLSGCRLWRLGTMLWDFCTTDPLTLFMQLPWSR